MSYESEGVILIYGRDERAIEATDLLRTTSTSLLIRPPAAVLPPRVTEYPVVKGLIRAAKGHLGAFELTVDDFAQPAPSSRAALSFGASKNGAVSRCDIVLDLSGRRTAVRGSDLRAKAICAPIGDEPQCCAR